MPFSPAPRPAFRTAAVCAFLVTGTVLLFLRGLDYGFSNYDDPSYITNNLQVQGGLSWAGLVWAFTAPTDYWHPLTWLSHMLDWQLYGPSAIGHHLTSVLWHALNAVLVFLLFRRLTGAFWTSAFAAAVFAWHPLRVESVVWITERKDVMSGAFFLLTLLAYVRYAGRRAAAQPWLTAYLVTLACFAAGLMSKPMIVTLPLVLLILDVWPLGRLTARAGLRLLLLEKLPLFALSAATALLTIVMQRQHGAFVLDLPLGARAANAVVSVARYLGKFFWPFDLIVCYPHPGTWPALVVVAATTFVAALSWLAWSQRHARPWILAGWLWLLVVLLPILGLVQVGFQAMADRYTYLALLGVELALFWSLAPAFNSARGKIIATLAAVLLLVGGVLRTWNQQAVWRDPVTLFQHAIAVSNPNDIAEDFLGYTLLGLGRLEEAELHAERARALNSRSVTALVTLAKVRERQGRTIEASEFYRAALARRPDDTLSRYRLGVLELGRGHIAEARELIVAAIRHDPLLREKTLQLGLVAFLRHDHASALFLNEVLLAVAPDDARAHFGAALAANAAGRTDEALAHYRAVIRVQPDSAEAHAAVGALLLARGDAANAITPLRLAVEYKPALADAQLALARCAEKLGRTDEALAALARAVSAAPDQAEIQGGAAEIYARLRDFASAARLYRRAVELAPDNSGVHAALGYMLLLTGDRTGALAEWERALELKPDFPGLRERVDAVRRQP